MSIPTTWATTCHPRPQHKQIGEVVTSNRQNGACQSSSSCCCVLMLTDMPISIARPRAGLFTMDRGADRVGCSKLFLGSKCEILGDPVFLHPRQATTGPMAASRGERRLRHHDGRSPARRPGAGRRSRLRPVRRGVGVARRRRWLRSARSCRWSKRTSPEQVRCRRRSPPQVLRILIPPSIVMVM